MEITAKQTKRIERLRKQLRLWPRVRWLLMFNGIVATVACMFCIWFVTGFVREQRRQLGLLFSDINLPAFRSPDGIQLLARSISAAIGAQDSLLDLSALFYGWTVLFALLAMWHFFILSRDWHGNAEKTLLLKLYDEAIGRQNEAVKPTVGAGLSTAAQTEIKRGS